MIYCKETNEKNVYILWFGLQGCFTQKLVRTYLTTYHPGSRPPENEVIISFESFLFEILCLNFLLDWF